MVQEVFDNRYSVTVLCEFNTLAPLCSSYILLKGSICEFLIIVNCAFREFSKKLNFSYVMWKS